MTNVTPLQQPEPATFEDWWQLQHHKLAKPICKMKWDAITSPEGYRTKAFDKSTNEYVELHLKASPQEIFAGQKRQNSRFFEEHGFQNNSSAKQFLRRPQQWLNQGGWMDE